MPSELLNFKLEHLSVGNAAQNLAFYTLVMLMILVVVVQNNAHRETGTRKAVLSYAARLSYMMHCAYHELYLAVRNLWPSRR
ncbi:hypothetical protein [Mucilaginibacter pedocola]|uniref:Uncharacterized protein n=1 Tax=Mucilaginibacter pedocola TaxID=1792845 RepID=A0A1S9P9D7_9SPHI|nr:hypothetical protein [Mucilaginibacter pedocola]OOQ57198.1 hypothetical protein BC343_16905 [Mucilaginibacter pedocola]